MGFDRGRKRGLQNHQPEKWPMCFGPESFIERIKAPYGAEKLDKEISSRWNQQ
jgi:hypothetical protein